MPRSPPHLNTTHELGTTMPMTMQEWRDCTAAASNAADALREALRLVGAPERTINSVRGSTTHRGRPLVHIGHLPAEVAERLAGHAGCQDSGTKESAQ